MMKGCDHTALGMLQSVPNSSEATLTVLPLFGGPNYTVVFFCGSPGWIPMGAL